MKRMLIFFLLSLFSTGCSRAASTAMPTQPDPNFPTPAVGSMRECAPTDFLSSASSNGDSGAVTLGLTLTNKSGSICKLTNPPQAQLLDGNSEVLQTQIIPNPAEQTPPAPAILALAANDSVIVTLVWKNYCQPLPGTMLTLRLTLAQDKTVDVPLKLPAVPSCDVKTEPSTILVAPYSNPP